MRWLRPRGLDYALEFCGWSPAGTVPVKPYVAELLRQAARDQALRKTFEDAKFLFPRRRERIPREALLPAVLGLAVLTALEAGVGQRSESHWKEVQRIVEIWSED